VPRAFVASKARVSPPGPGPISIVVPVGERAGGAGDAAASG
jgi:hypothetical protein